MSIVFKPDFAKGVSEIVSPAPPAKAPSKAVSSAVAVSGKRVVCRFEEDCESSSKSAQWACGLALDGERAGLCVEFCRLRNAVYGFRRRR